MPFEIKQNRVGEKGFDTDGVPIEICDYKGTKEIFVKWADGFVKKSSYYKFSHNLVHRPTGKRKSPTADARLGEVRMMNCGQKAKIIAYRAQGDIDV